MLAVHRRAAVTVDPWEDRNWARGVAALVLQSVYTFDTAEAAPETEVRTRLHSVGTDAETRSGVGAGA